MGSIPPPAMQPGEVVAGKYRVDRIIGEGGMGIVLVATHLQLEQRVALKVLLPSLVTNAEVVRRFVREARAAVKIQSEHVARVIDVGTLDDGTPYMVMEYLEGQDLERVLVSRGAATVEEGVGYILQACEALAEAHAHGIVHRDLKPSNLFLAKRPGGKSIIKVLDFGISKAPATARDGAATSANALMGSPLYMSPEQIMSPTTVDVRSDIWCLGVVLYELFAHKVPFEADGMPQLVFQVVQQPHASLRTLRPDVPEGLSAAVDRCLSKKQEDRFQNVAELARALAPFGPARSDQSIERIEHVLGMAAAEPQQTGPGPILPRRQGGMTFVPTTSQATTIRGRQYVLPVVLGSLLVLGVGGFFLVRAAAHPGGDRAVAAPAVPAATTAAPPPSAEPPPEVLAPPPSASAPAVATAAPSSSVPWWYGKQAAPAPRGSSSAHPAASSPAAAPTCHVVSFFDADGNKHFKQECP